MKKSKQDTHYFEHEGDNFFKRNFAGKTPPQLRGPKVSILEQILSAGKSFPRVLEYGCNYGDLLNRFLELGVSTYCVGVEASSSAIAFGRELYADRVVFHHGTIAENPINQAGEARAEFDLIIVDDVFGWVSRETIFESVANIHGVLADGGLLFIRDFLPNGKAKNPNHHVADGSVFNFKVPGSHSTLFLASGSYEVVWQRTFMDQTSMSANYKSKREFESRWADTVLKKSLTGYFLD